jgi:hypothetical protein
MAKSVSERQAEFHRRLRESGGRHIAFDLEAGAIGHLELIAESMPGLTKTALLTRVLADYAKRHKLIST